MPTIIITGTPGTGKSTIAKLIAKKLHFRRIDVASLIRKKKLSEGYDKKRGTQIIDAKKLNKELIGIIKNSKQSLVIDSHLSHHLPKEYVDLCVVARCDIKTLKKRLQIRKYPKQKIRENLDCEIFQVCLNEAVESGHNVFAVNTSPKAELKGLFRRISLYNKKHA